MKNHTLSAYLHFPHFCIIYYCCMKNHTLFAYLHFPHFHLLCQRWRRLLYMTYTSPFSSGPISTLPSTPTHSYREVSRPAGRWERWRCLCFDPSFCPSPPRSLYEPSWSRWTSSLWCGQTQHTLHSRSGISSGRKSRTLLESCSTNYTVCLTLKTISKHDFYVYRYISPPSTDQAFYFLGNIYQRERERDREREREREKHFFI